MGMFEVKVKLANLAEHSRTAEVSLLVDTHATVSWIPRDTLERLGVKPLSRLPFSQTDGGSVESEVGGALLTVERRSAGITVAFGELGERAVLGLTAVEALEFTIDPVARKLIPRMLRGGTNVCCGAYS